MEIGLSKDVKFSEWFNIDDILMVIFIIDVVKNMCDWICWCLVGVIDEYMKVQVVCLVLVNISMIYFFCEQLIKCYYYVIDFDFQFWLIDDVEQQFLKEQVW